MNKFIFFLWIHFSLLDEMISPNSAIRLQDTNRLFGLVANNPIGHEVAMSWLAEKWDDIDE